MAQELTDLIATLDQPQPGEIWLVGAGPGDPGQLTVQAIVALRHADLVLVDALVSSEVVKLINPRAKISFVGKRGGLPSPSQAEITAQAIAGARRQLRVIRLKGGDPLLFARGGEEALAYQAAGVPFRLVAGISAGLGGLASAAIPVTHRGLSGQVTLLTGHAQTGELPDDLDWPRLGRDKGTQVWYMARRNAVLIAETLIRHGMAAKTEVALVAQVSRPAQEVVRTTLGVLAGDGLTLSEGPLVMVIGAVVGLSRQLSTPDVVDHDDRVAANAAWALTRGLFM